MISWIPRQYFGQLKLTDNAAPNPPSAHYALTIKIASAVSAPLLYVQTSWDGTSDQRPRKPQRLVVFDGPVTLNQSPVILFDEPGNPLTPGIWTQKPLLPKSDVLWIMPLHQDADPVLWSSNDPTTELKSINPDYPGARLGMFTFGYQDQYGGGAGSPSYPWGRCSLNATFQGAGVTFIAL